LGYIGPTLGMAVFSS